MYLGSWRQRILIILGLLLAVMPVVGLPLLFKNILTVFVGVFLVVVILASSEYGKTHTKKNVVEKKEEVGVVVEKPTFVYQESVTEVYQEAEVESEPVATVEVVKKEKKEEVKKTPRKKTPKRKVIAEATDELTVKPTSRRMKIDQTDLVKDYAEIV